MTKHERISQSIVRAARPQFLEAPSSWLTRLALTQGAEIGEVLAHMGLNRKGDVDLLFAMRPLGEFEQMLGGAVEALVPAVRILRNIAKIDADGGSFLWRTKASGQFFYCPHCLMNQPTSHIPIHWRVRTWRHCPIHQCLLETGCPHCQAPTLLPQNLLVGGPKRKGVANLKHCCHCDKSIAAIEPFCLTTHGHGALSSFDWYLLKNGRAALASLYTGKFFVQGSEHNQGLRGLMSFYKRGLIPSRIDWLHADLLKRRLTSKAARANLNGEEASPGVGGADL